MSSETVRPGYGRLTEVMEPPGHQVSGVRATTVGNPLHRAELVDLVRQAAADGSTLGVCGAGTKIDRGNAPSSLDLLVQTTGLNRIVEHAAGDLVVTVEPGVPLEELQAELAGSRQWLALDPPEPGATVGGIVAAAASGPRRLRWGTPRDLLIGLTVVLADGTVARSGGKVVKNVAGYDLGKLFTGSFGTLGIIAELTFRLHPLPPAHRVVTLSPATSVGEVVARIRGSGVQASAVEWDGERLTVLIEAAAPIAAAQAEKLRAAVGGDVGEDLPPGFGQLPWQRRTVQRRRDAGQIGLKVTHRLGALDAALTAAGRVLPHARVRAHAASGVLWLGHDDGTLDGLAELRSAIAELDGQVVVVEAPPEAKTGVDVWGPVGGLDVMRRVKEQFDPERRMSPGRFVGGL
jgi:glycolate oxidase FAD binding subunit